MSVYVGIDVHRKRSQVAVVTEDGTVQLNKNVVNGSEPMLRLIGDLPAGTPVAFEAAFGWGWLVELLEDYGFDPHLVHPLRCKAIASARLKNDLLTELSDVSAAQAGRPSQCSIAEMPGRSGLPGCCGLVASPIATEPDIRGVTSRLPSPRCRSSTSAAAALERFRSARDLLRHANLATQLALFGEDKVDAAILAQLLRADLLPEAWIAPPKVRQLRALLRHRAGLVRLGTQLRNRIHAVAADHGYDRSASYWTGPGRGWLAELDLPAASREIVKRSAARASQTPTSGAGEVVGCILVRGLGSMLAPRSG